MSDNNETAVIEFECSSNTISVCRLPAGTVNELHHLRQCNETRFFVPYSDRDMLATQSMTGAVYLFDISEAYMDDNGFEDIFVTKVPRLANDFFDTTDSEIAFNSDDVRAVHRIISAAVAATDKPLIFDPRSENELVEAFENLPPASDEDFAEDVCVATLKLRAFPRNFVLEPGQLTLFG